MEIVLVQFPPESLPYDHAAMEPLWVRLESWMDATLRAAGGGRCLAIDLSSELTAIGEAPDAGRAVEALAAALPGAGLPDAAVIAVREADDDVVRWPPERAGELLPPGR